MRASLPLPPEAGDPRLARLLDSLGLERERELDRSGDFLTLCCRDADGARWVLKYCYSEATDALHRLHNEAMLTRRLPVRPPLRLLRHRADGPGWLLTAYERGEPLGVRHLGDATLMPRIAEALVVLQSMHTVRDLPLYARESTRRFMHKVLVKHLLHLCPELLGRRDAWRVLASLRAALDDIDALAVPCHADCMPTNMLRDADGDDVVLIDFEGFIVGHHPLYDVLSFMTIDPAPLDAWHWQGGFLRHYLAHTPLAPRLAPGSARFARTYRALLLFLLAYRYNEALLNAVAGCYFDGETRPRWVLRRLVRLLTGLGVPRLTPTLRGDLATRRDNLALALDPASCALHLAHMLDATASVGQTR